MKAQGLSSSTVLCLSANTHHPHSNNNLGHDHDYSQAGPPGTHRSPTPKNAWDECSPTPAPQVTPEFSANRNAKGPNSAWTRDKAKARPSSSKPLTTSTTRNNRSNPVPAQGARTKNAQLLPPPVPRRTRARSRSLEPTSAIAQAGKPTKRKRNSRASVLVPVTETQIDEHESDFEEQDEQIDVGPRYAAILGCTQTLEEEHAMDHLLNESISTIVVEPELEDDTQTIRAFEATENNEKGDEDNMEDAGGHSYLHPLNLSVIDRLQSRHRTRRSSKAPFRPPSVFSSRSSEPLFQVNGAPSLRSSMAPPNQVFTPMPHRPPRSTRAIKLIPQFPSPGTCTKGVKERKERESKYTPYEPPVGTRASAYKAYRLV